MRVAAATLAIAWIALVAGYVFGAAEASFTAGAGVAAAVAVAIGAAGFLYAWREPAPLER